MQTYQLDAAVPPSVVRYVPATQGETALAPSGQKFPTVQAGLHVKEANDGVRQRERTHTRKGGKKKMQLGG